MQINKGRLAFQIESLILIPCSMCTDSGGNEGVRAGLICIWDRKFGAQTPEGTNVSVSSCFRVSNRNYTDVDRVLTHGTAERSHNTALFRQSCNFSTSPIDALTSPSQLNHSQVTALGARSLRHVRWLVLSSEHASFEYVACHQQLH